MAITFVQAKKRQKVLTLVLLLVVVITAVVVWRGFFATPTALPPVIASPFPIIRIDFDILESKELEAIPLLDPILPLPEEDVGRANPFVPF